MTSNASALCFFLAFVAVLFTPAYVRGLYAGRRK